MKEFLVKTFVNLIGMIIMFAMLNCVVYLFVKPEIFTISFTNIGFAVFLALGNTSFSWARSLTDPRSTKYITEINQIGSVCIFNAITTLVTSLLNFLISNRIAKQGDYYIIDSAYSAGNFIKGTLLFIVVFCAFYIVFKIYRVFYWFAKDLFKFKS